MAFKLNIRILAFTLAEVLIVLGVIGIVAEMTIPTLMNNVQSQTYVAGVLKFNSTLHQAILMWKQDINCYSDAGTCLSQQGLGDNDCTNFDQIGKFMRISDKSLAGATANWLPASTSNYAGVAQTGVWGGVSNASTGLCKYLLQDGTTFTMDVDPAQIGIFVDVNGKKPPNRMGKDTFTFTIGSSSKDVTYYPVANEAVRDAEGLCSMLTSCNPTNLDPAQYNGASPTAYVITTQKAPNFYN